LIDAEDKFWTFALRLSALSLACSSAFVALPNFGLNEMQIGVWFLISLLCFTVSKIQSSRRDEDDDIPWDM